MHVIDESNVPDAWAALRDILFLLRDAATGGQLDESNDTGTFDALRYVDCRVEDDVIEKDDLRLLQEGSGVKLLVELITAGDNATWPPESPAVRAALDDGRLSHLPLLESALADALAGEEQFVPHLAPVYDAYVRGTFRRLAE